jgi:hypothetical protein
MAAILALITAMLHGVNAPGKNGDRAIEFPAAPGVA